jgi:hypothetical protein
MDKMEKMGKCEMNRHQQHRPLAAVHGGWWQSNQMPFGQPMDEGHTSQWRDIFWWKVKEKGILYYLWF